MVFSGIDKNCQYLKIAKSILNKNNHYEIELKNIR
jgi:hypothetical protein